MIFWKFRIEVEEEEQEEQEQEGNKREHQKFMKNIENNNTSFQERLLGKEQQFSFGGPSFEPGLPTPLHMWVAITSHVWVVSPCMCEFPSTRMCESHR